jgi:sec-independent protein translocase protein TatA
MFDLFQPTHLLFVLLVALVVFGPKRLLEMSRSLGQTVRSVQEYKEALTEELIDPTEDGSEEEHPPEAVDPRSDGQTTKG